jgi:vitamin B12 transporter
VAPLPDIVVSATRLPTPADQVASSVTVITATDLQQEQRRTVPDALTMVPGLNVVQTGGPGGQTSVFIRGTNSNQVKVLIDGIDASDPSNPNASFDFGQLLTGDIERIEILRGPQSGLYGADAIGGVISITTKGGSGPPKFTASSEGGSFGTFNQTVGLSGSISIFNYAFNIVHFKSTDTPVTPGVLLPIGQPGRNNYHDNYTYSTRLGVDLTDSFSVNGVARYTDSTLLFTENPPDVSRSSQVDHQLYTRGEAIWKPFGDVFVNTFGLAYSNVWTRNLDPNPAPASPTFDLGERVKADWRGVWQFFPDQKLIFGLEDENERLDTGTFAASNSNKAGYVELQSAIGDRLFVAANARHDDNENFGGHDTYRIAPTFLIQETGTKLKASYGTGFKAPSLSELFENFPAFDFFGNPNLKPEGSKGYDLGLEQQAFGILSFGSTYFHNDIHDLIATNASQTSFTNIGQATTWGFENFAELTLTDQFKLRADYTFTIARDDIARQELLRRPKNKASLRADYVPLPKLNLSATLVYVGSWIDGNRDFSIPRLRASPYAIVNLATNYEVDERTTVFGRIDNLLDRHYQDPVGFERSGFGAYAGIRVTVQ